MFFFLYFVVVSFFSFGCGTDNPDSIAFDTTTEPHTCPWQSPEDIVVSDLSKFSGEFHDLSMNELKEDLLCLREIFQKEYVAAYYFEQRGISLVSKLDALFASLKETLNQEELMEQLISLHREAYDSHLTYVFLSENKTFGKRLPSYSIYYSKIKFEKEGDFYVSVPTTNVDNKVAIKECQEMKPHVVLDNADLHGHYRFVGQFFGSEPVADEVVCKTSDNRDYQISIAKKQVDDLSNYPDGINEFHYKFIDNDILYVRMPEMTPGISNEQQALIDILADESQQYPILFDLRQNGGGDDAIAHTLAMTLRSKTQKLPDLAL